MLIASATFGLKCHDLQTGEIVHSYTPPLAKNVYIKHFAWNKDGTWLAVTPNEGTTFIVSIKNSNIKQLHKISNIQAPTCSIFKHETKKYLSLGTANGSVLTYDFKTENISKKYPKVDSEIFALYYCSNDSHLIAGCTNGEIIVFNAISTVKSSKFRIPNSKTLTCLRPHHKKRNLLAGGSQNGSVAIWDLNQSKLKYCNKFHSAPVKDISFLPNREDILLSIGMDKKIRFQDIKTNVAITEIDFEEVMTCMDVSYDSTNMIIGTQNGNIHIYDVRNIKSPKLSIEKAHDSWIERIAIQTSITQETDLSLKSIVAESTSALTAITEESPMQNDLKKPKPTIVDSFIDEFGTNDSLTSPIHHNKRRSSQNFRPKSTSECSEVDDSFLDFLALNSPNNQNKNSLGPISKKVESLLLEKPEILEQGEVDSPILRANKTRLLQEVREEELLESPLKDLAASENKVTSTPKLTASNEELKNTENNMIVVGDIRKMFEEVILEKRTEEIDSLKKEIKQIVTETMGAFTEELKDLIKGQTTLLLEKQRVEMWRFMEFQRQLEAEKHMYRVKQSLKIEEAFVDLATLISSEIVNEEGISNHYDIH